MLRIGLTGGIGAGKSAVSSTFAQCGAVIVDGDVIAREVVEPGTEGLKALVETFGPDILLPDGSLDRPALAAKAFRDDEERRKLNGIVHPLVGKRRAEIIASVAEDSADSVVVEDIPLLVESGMAPLFPLVVVVHADVEVRVRRVDHIGSTVFSGYPDFEAKDVIDVQITVESLAIADELAEPLLSAGYPRLANITEDTARTDARSTVERYDHSDDAALWRKRIHASADPGRPTNLHVRVDGWPTQQFALLFADWLRAKPEVRGEYLDVKRTAERGAGGDVSSYADAKEPWFTDAYRRAWEWADTTRWRPEAPRSQ